MTTQWMPDVTDKSLITTDKAAFLYDCSTQFLKETLNVDDTLKESARKAMAVLITIISALSGYMIVNCDGATHLCSKNAHILTPACVLVAGYTVAAGIILFKCLWTCHFAFNGNEPRNLLQTSIVKHDLDRIKIGSLVGIQSRIETNVTNNLKVASFLNWAYLVSGFTPILAGLISLW